MRRPDHFGERVAGRRAPAPVLLRRAVALLTVAGFLVLSAAPSLGTFPPAPSSPLPPPRAPVRAMSPAEVTAPTAAPPAATPLGGWANITSTPSPGHVGDAGMAWDPVLHALVLFGGYGTAVTNSTWLYDANGTWSNVTSSAGTPPSARWGMDFNVHYDPNFGGVLLYGGCDAYGNSLGDLWLFNGTWTNLTVRYPGGPGPLQYGSGAFDAYDNYSVYFGGAPSACGTGTTNETWTLTPGAGWTKLTPSQSPPALRGASMVYDPMENATILFGGRDSSGTFYNATWSFRGGAWSPIHPARAPRAGYLESMTYLPSEQYLLEYGGCQAGGCLVGVNSTWAFSNGTWLNVSAVPPGGPNPGPLGGGAIAFDPSLGEAILVGGTYGTSRTTNTHSSGVWSFTPPPLAAQFGTLPPVLPPGSFLTLSIAATGGSLEYRYQYAGLPSYCPSQDLPRMRCVFTGLGNYTIHETLTDSLGATVEGSFLVRVLASLSAQVIWSPTAIDLGMSAIVASRAGGAIPPIAYDWLELPPGCAAADLPQLNCTPSRVGTFPAEVEITDSTGRNSTAWANLTVNTPPLLLISVSGLAGDAPYAVRALAIPQGGTAPYAFVWDWGDGSITVGGTNATHTYAGGGTYLLNVSLEDSAGRWANASRRIVVAGAPSVAVRVDSYYVPTCGGTPVYNLSASVVGGTAPYSFAWSFGDGSPGTSGAAVQHTYASGAHDVTLTMTDGAGTRASTVLPVSVPSVPACPAPAPAGGGGPLGTTTYLLLLAAAIVIGLTVLIVRRRPPRRPKAGAPPPAGP